MELESKNDTPPLSFSIVSHRLNAKLTENHGLRQCRTDRLPHTPQTSEGSQSHAEHSTTCDPKSNATDQSDNLVPS